jgi:hypothetical protein
MVELPVHIGRLRIVTMDQAALVMAGLSSDVCSGQQKLATDLEFFQNNRSDSFGVKPPLY